MQFVTNLFLVMGVQNLSKSVKICQSYWQKFAAAFFYAPQYTTHSALTKVCCRVLLCSTVYNTLGIWELHMDSKRINTSYVELNGYI